MTFARLSRLKGANFATYSRLCARGETISATFTLRWTKIHRAFPLLAKSLRLPSRQQPMETLDKIVATLERLASAPLPLWMRGKGNENGKLQ
jgi:hypothetical protein